MKTIFLKSMSVLTMFAMGLFIFPPESSHAQMIVRDDFQNTMFTGGGYGYPGLSNIYPGSFMTYPTFHFMPTYPGYSMPYGGGYGGYGGSGGYGGGGYGGYGGGGYGGYSYPYNFSVQQQQQISGFGFPGTFGGGMYGGYGGYGSYGGYGGYGY